MPVLNSLVSTNKVVVDSGIDTDMVPEFPGDATQNPLDYIPKAEPSKLKDLQRPFKFNNFHFHTPYTREKLESNF